MFFDVPLGATRQGASWGRGGWGVGRKENVG